MPDDDGLAQLWGRRPPARRGPRPALTLERIVGSAIALADADGIEAVSMARLAESLGVTTMALYRYVASKDDLLAHMVDTAVGEARTPDATAAPERAPADADADADRPPWRAGLERWCHAQLEVTAAHPWLVPLMSRIAVVGPNRAQILESGLAALEDTPLPIGLRTEVIGRLSLGLMSEATLQAAIAEFERGVVAAAAGGPPPQPRHPALLDYATLLRRFADPARYPQITAAIEAGVFDPTAESAEDPDLGVRMLLDGVAALIARWS